MTTRRETTDVNIAGVLVFTVVLVVSAVVIFGAVWALYRRFGETTRAGLPEFPLASAALRRLPPEPRLQTDPRDDLAGMRQAEERTLTTYGWVDRNAGIVRIPIEHAMTLTAERGLPSR